MRIAQPGATQGVDAPRQWRSQAIGSEFIISTLTSQDEPDRVPRAWARQLDRPTAALLLGCLAFMPLLVWWLGWFPGLMSSDSIDQWNQVLTFEFQNSHPIAHTASMWAVSLVWESPGAVALVQIAAMAAVLAVVARRLVQLGVQFWLSVIAVWVIAVLPMTSATTITIWKDIPFSIAMLWAASELMLMAVNRATFWTRIWGPLRLGTALGLMWALRANGLYTVIIVVVCLAVGFRNYVRPLATLGGAVGSIGILVPAILVVTLPVFDNPIEPAQVFMPDVGAVVVHDIGALSQHDLDLVMAVAPIDTWLNRYACGDSSPLVFDPTFDSSQIRDHSWDYRWLIARTAAAAPGTVLGHRWCAAEYLISPMNRTDTFVHRPPYDIWPNTLGLARSPISDRAFAATDVAYRAFETSALEWLTWRPAIWVLAGLATFAAFATRRRLRPLLWIGLLFSVQLLNVAATSPSHEFRYAFGLYLVALSVIPMWELVIDPDRANIDSQIEVSSQSEACGSTQT